MKKFSFLVAIVCAALSSPVHAQLGRLLEDFKTLSDRARRPQQGQQAQPALPVCPSDGIKENCTGQYVSPSGREFSAVIVNGKIQARSIDGFSIEGDFNGYHLHGKGRSRLPDGRVYSGDWQNGFPHGFGMIQDASGRILTQGRFEAGNLVEAIHQNPAQQAQQITTDNTNRQEASSPPSNLQGAQSSRPNNSPQVVSNYKDYCAKLLGNPTIKRYTEEIIRARGIGNEFASAVARNSIDSKDGLLTRFVTQQYEVYLSNRNPGLKAQISNEYATWAYTCSFENKDSHLMVFLDPEGSGAVAQDMNQQFAAYQARSANPSRTINADGSIVDASQGQARFFVIPYDRKPVSVDDPINGLYATIFAVGLADGERVIERVGAETINIIKQATVAQQQRIDAENERRLAAENERKRQEREENAARAQAQAAEEAQRKQRAEEFQKRLIAHNRNAILFFRSVPDFKRSYDACVRSEEIVVDDEVKRIRAASKNVNLVAERDALEKEAASLERIKPSYAVAACISRAYALKNALASGQDPALLSPVKNISAPGNWRANEFTEKGNQAFSRLLGAKRNDVVNACVDSFIEVARSSGLAAGVRKPDWDRVRREYDLMCRSLIEPNRETYLDPVIRYSREILE